MKTRILAGALAVGLAAAAQAQAQAPALSMDCHMMLRGVPSKDATSFQLVGNDLYSVRGSTRTKISTQGTPVALGTSREKDGTTTTSFASHTLQGTTLQRTVYWKKANEEMKPAFRETYDFKAKTLTSSSDPADMCHANAR